MQALFDRRGGLRERQAPVWRLHVNAANIADAYTRDGTFLGSVAWRPHEPALAADGGLFVCG